MNPLPALASLGVLLALPAVLGSYGITVFILVFFYGYLGQAWNIVSGYGGQLSAGHAAFLGVGAYTATLLAAHTGLTPWVGMLAGAATAGLLGALIGALVSPILPFQPASGLTASVASFNIVIVGGMGSLFGAFVGGLLVSVAESLGAVFLAPSMKELVSFSLLIAILLFRPAGLFGRRA